MRTTFQWHHSSPSMVWIVPYSPELQRSSIEADSATPGEKKTSVLVKWLIESHQGKPGMPSMVTGIRNAGPLPAVDHPPPPSPLPAVMWPQTTSLVEVCLSDQSGSYEMQLTRVTYVRHKCVICEVRDIWDVHLFLDMVKWKPVCKTSFINQWSK